MKNNTFIPNPNNAEAVKFLNRFNPNGLWVLSAINPHTKEIKTETFKKEEGENLDRWLNAYNGIDNIYYSVNSVNKVLNKKAKKEDIKSVDWLHVDIDPDGAQDLEKERDRILNSLTDKRPKIIPEPTVIVFSGGGFQAFWKLEDPVIINGELTKAEDAALYNKYLEKMLNGDSCHNVDRIMRLPGTWNIPDEKKLSKGRKKTLARVLEFNKAIYKLADFKKESQKNNIVSSYITIDQNDCLPKNIDEICKWGVSPNYKDLIINGFWPNNPNKYPSRSEAEFAVVCELVRASVPDSIIEWVLTNRDFKISEKVLEQNNPIKFTQSEIKKAREKVSIDKPRIILAEGFLNEILDKAENALINGNVGIYQRGQTLVRVVTLNKSSYDDGVCRSDGSSMILAVNSKWLTQKICDTALCLRANRNGDLTKTDPKAVYAEHILSRVGEWKFRVLKGIINAPTLREDGSILQTEGYDTQSHLIFDANGYSFPKIPESPDRIDAQEALEKIKPIFSKFPFIDEYSRSVVIAMVLTGLIRRTIKTAPLFAIDAPTAGTGKSMLSEICSILLVGHLPAMVSQGKDEEEDQKRLSSILMAGDAMIVIDNCEREVTGDFLCSMLTQEIVQTRILGKSEMVMLPSNALVVATGNNLILAGDMTRRALICRIDSREERPDMRQFEFDPREKAKETRGEVVVACLTILRAYIVAGRPNKLPKIGSFEEWNIVREALVWLGCADPEETRKDAIANDPKKNMLIELLNQWEVCFNNNPKSLTQINNSCTEMTVREDLKILYQMLIDLSGQNKFNARSIGRRLLSHVGRVVDGKMLLKEQDSHGARWYVCKAK